MHKVFFSLALFFGSTVQVSAAEPNPFSVAILMFDGVQIIDFAAPYEVFGQARFQVFTVSAGGGPVTTAMNLSVNPSHSFDDVPAVDAILVPGGDVHNAMQDKDVQRWLKAQHASSDHVLSICTGAYLLAEAKLLDGRQATTFHRSLAGFAEDYPQIDVVRDQRFVDTGKIITSAGLSSGIDAALHLVSKVQGVEKAKTIAMHLEYDWDPQHGFVRGKMADRFFPDANQQWPKGTRFERLSEYGDMNYWQKTYRINSRAGAETIANLYRKSIDGLPNWQPESTDQSNGQAGSWRGKNDRDGWRHAFQLTQASGGDWLAKVEIERIR